MAERFIVVFLLGLHFNSWKILWKSNWKNYDSIYTVSPFFVLIKHILLLKITSPAISTCTLSICNNTFKMCWRLCPDAPQICIKTKYSVAKIKTGPVTKIHVCTQKIVTMEKHHEKCFRVELKSSGIQS